MTAKITRGDVNGMLSNALWEQPHSAEQRYELYDRALNNELDFDLRAVDDAILDTGRQLQERGARIVEECFALQLRRYYPLVVPTLIRRILGREVSAPDLFFDDVAGAIWNAIPPANKVVEMTGHQK